MKISLITSAYIGKGADAKLREPGAEVDTHREQAEELIRMGAAKAMTKADKGAAPPPPPPPPPPGEEEPPQGSDEGGAGEQPQ